RQELEPALGRELLARDDERPGPVVHARGVAGGGRTFGIEGRLEPRELLVGRVATRALVDRELADGNDLVPELARVNRSDGALVRAQRPAVLVLARDAELARDERRLFDHVALVK